MSRGRPGCAPSTRSAPARRPRRPPARRPRAARARARGGAHLLARGVVSQGRHRRSAQCVQGVWGWAARAWDSAGAQRARAGAARSHALPRALPDPRKTAIPRAACAVRCRFWVPETSQPRRAQPCPKLQRAPPGAGRACVPSRDSSPALAGPPHLVQERSAFPERALTRTHCRRIAARGAVPHSLRAREPGIAPSPGRGADRSGETLSDTLLHFERKLTSTRPLEPFSPASSRQVGSL